MTARYTAAEVRAAIDWLWEQREQKVSPHPSCAASACAMLTDYAARLEQEEALIPIVQDGVLYMMPMNVTDSGHKVTAESLREEGKQQLLLEVAQIPEPTVSIGKDVLRCLLCFADLRYYMPPGLSGMQLYTPDKHKPDCLWLRAQQAAQGE